MCAQRGYRAGGNEGCHLYFKIIEGIVPIASGEVVLVKCMHCEEPSIAHTELDAFF